MIRRIRIRNFKSLKDVEVHLQPLSVIVGPNASGKSNFLDALQLLSRAATRQTLKEAFVPPCRGTPLESFAFDPGGIEGLLKKESVSLSIEADVVLSQAVIDTVNAQIREMRTTRSATGSNRSSGKKLPQIRERYLRYRIEIEIRPKSGILRVADEYLAALNRQGLPSRKRGPFLSRENDRLHLRMEGQAHPTFHDLYLDHSILSLSLYPPHYPHLVAMRRELESWFLFYFEPRERMRLPSPVKEVHHIGLMGEDLASFLNTLRATDGERFEALERSLKMLIPSISGIQVEANSLGEVDLSLIEGQTPIPARVLSEGTLRVLGLLALGVAGQPQAVIGFEEPENGVHPHRLQLIARFLEDCAETGDTQYIVTTHSPHLPDFIRTEFLYKCRKKRGCTTIEHFPETMPMFKRQGVDRALEDPEEETPISERILRDDL